MKQAISQNGFDLTDFSTWIRDRLIDPLNTVRSLTTILRNPRARDVFLSDGAREAQRLIDAAPLDINLENEELAKLYRVVTVKLRKIPWADVKRLQQSPESDEARSYLELYDELKTFIEANMVAQG